MLGIGVGLLVATGLASPAASSDDATSAKKGGTLRLSKSTDIDYVDPALAYFTDSWEMEYATCAKLFNYPDKAAPAGSSPCQRWLVPTRSPGTARPMRSS